MNKPGKESKRERGFLQLNRAKVSHNLNSEGNNQVNFIKHIRELND